MAETTAALSELAESFAGDEERRIKREDFEAVLRRHLSGSHAEQQIAQLWDKLCRGGGDAIGQGDVCSFLLQQMQQRESQARAHATAPLPHHPAFCSALHSKETICAVLPLASPPQYLTVSKDGCLGVWSTRFQLQLASSVSATAANDRGRDLAGAGRGRRGPGAVWVTACVMVSGRLVVATTARELSFYDTTSFSCLHKLHKLPCVPLCMAYGSEDENSSSSPGHLVWGDESGCVGILSFLQPSKPLFHSTLIPFSRLGEQAPGVVLRYIQAHSEWVCQVGWTGPAHCIISAAQSPAPSLLIQHVWAQRKQYVFRVRMGVSCFAYSHCLEVLATGSLDHVVRLWTPFSPQRPVACLTCHISAVVGIAIATEPRHLFSLAQDLSLCVWDIGEHHLLQTVSVKFPFTQRLPDFGPSPLSLVPLPQPTLTVACNEYVARFTLSSGAMTEGVGSDASHTNPVCAVAYSPLLDQLVSGCEGGEVKVWEVTSGRCIMKVEGCHGDQELTALAVDGGGGRILTGARDGAIKVWEALTGQCLQRLGTPGATEVTHILHHAERRRFLATGWNRTITAFKDQAELGLRPEPAWSEGTPHCDDIIALDYCPPHYLATGSFDGLTLVWNTDTERVMSRFHSMAKMTPLLLDQRRRSNIGSRSHTPFPSLLSRSTHFRTSPLPGQHSHTTSALSSRQASKRLSSYRLKSANSNHLHHAPVDQLLFLKARVRSKVIGQSALVSSEGGHAHFWDMFGTGQPMGSFPLTSEEGEVVLAMATDESCRWLLAGDTAGYLSLFNIAQFCTALREDEEVPEAEYTWRAHASEILDVVWAGPNFLVSASADHCVRMWSTKGHYVGCFGQPQSWDSANAATFQHPASALPPSSIGSESCFAEPEKGGEAEEKGEGEAEERVMEQSPLETTPAEELAALQDKALGIAYRSGIEQRMAGRLERRTHFSAVGNSAFSCPFQALHMPVLGEVKLPQDVTALRSEH